MSQQSQELVDQLEARVDKIESDLRQTQVLLDAAQSLLQASDLGDIYKVLGRTIIKMGADRSTLVVGEKLDKENLPLFGRAVSTFDRDLAKRDQFPNHRFELTAYPTLLEVIRTHKPTVLVDTTTGEKLSPTEKNYFSRLDVYTVAIFPLGGPAINTGLLMVASRTHHPFTQQELDLVNRLCSQTTTALEKLHQKQRTEEALAETQTLYRAGRVLADATDLQEILEDSLVEFVYSLGLDQGGVTLISPDRQVGRLMAYLQDGKLQSIERLKFPLSERIPYQKILLSGKPFVSGNVAADPRLNEFKTFNKSLSTKSMLQAPMIIRGETIGWIGADALRERREFTQREIDLARAMADQIAVTIQNRRLLEKTEQRATRLKAVAKVGESVTRLTDLSEILDSTVDLIRDRFGFYHVSIFLLDESGQWAVVRASTGEVGRDMVDRPHQLGVGSNSIVGYATQHAKPRIASDVGEDAVHFRNPLLPDTHSEMALPLISRGSVIGALDVQSVEPNAFSDEDIEILQIMADQLSAAISNARLFEQTQRRLLERDMLYQIGTLLGSTLQLKEAAQILTTKTAEVFDVPKSTLRLIEEDQQLFTISDYVKSETGFRNEQGQRHRGAELKYLDRLLTIKQAFSVSIDDTEYEGQKQGRFKKKHETVMALTPILLRNEVIGLLEIYDDKPSRRFQREEISLLNSIALQAANVIENARLYAQAYESHTFMKAIIDQIPDPIFIKDRNHRLMVVNTAFSQEILGRPEQEVIGRSDYDLLPTELADRVRKSDNKMFETGEPQEREEAFTDAKGKPRILHTRRIPLALAEGEETPQFLIGLINDITERKQREAERERLIEETRRTLDRTQTLYRISDTLATLTEPQTIFETVLREYLKLLNLKVGDLLLFDRATNTLSARASFADGKPATPALVVPAEHNQIFSYLEKTPKPLIIEDVQNHPLLRGQPSLLPPETISKLFLPLTIRNQLLGIISVDVTTESHQFNPSDIDIGEAIADQLTIWLENRRLLLEARYRLDRLQTAAEVSRAASSILDIDELIDTSVNLIRDQFDFYYVGMFLIDQLGDWAVLRAGTGEAGKIQLAKNHRLKVGGESMIGWSVKHRKARIALDVGEDAVHFQNPDLPDTHSELALPLISRDDVIGALTVQSVERNAFSQEDITMLQTMADQLANAIANAHLFENVAEARREAEIRLQETQALQEFSHELVGSLKVHDIVDTFFLTCGVVIGAEYAEIALVDEAKQRIEAIAGLGVSEIKIKRDNYALDSNHRFAETIRTGQTEIITDWDEPIDAGMLEGKNYADLIRVIAPMTLRQENLGLVEIGLSKTAHLKFQKYQLRLLRALIDQMALALESAQRYEAAQKAAQREKIIRDISGKIRNAVTVDDILKTTMIELSKVVQASKGNITLTTDDISQQPLPHNADPVRNTDANTKRSSRKN